MGKTFADTERTIKALKLKTRRTENITHDEWVTSGEKDKLEKMSTEEWDDLKDMAISTILLSLVNNTLQEVLGLTALVDFGTSWRARISLNRWQVGCT